MREYFIREDKQGRCYISRVKTYEGEPDYVGHEDVLMIYKTRVGSVYQEDWEGLAKKICDFLNQEEAVVE